LRTDNYARSLGWRGEPRSPRIVLGDDERHRARTWLANNAIPPEATLCALHIGKGLRVDRVGWPVDRFIEIGRGLVRMHGVVCLLTGLPREVALTARVADGIGNGAVNLAGRTTDLRLFCGVIDHCSLLVGIDSGPMHAAAALGVPVVAAFPLASDCPARWHPFGVPHRIVRTDGWACPDRCVKEACRDFRCLSHINVVSALEGASALLPSGRLRLASAVSP
jgi:ADP-heptose:LPS heptosyltransferase